jgi:hypothetical protein
MQISIACFARDMCNRIYCFGYKCGMQLLGLGYSSITLTNGPSPTKLTTTPLIPAMAVLVPFPALLKDSGTVLRTRLCYLVFHLAPLIFTTT